MENLVFRILFSYTAFGGPLYKFYATWSQKEGVVRYEIESCYPDRVKKGELDEEKSKLFLFNYDNLIQNRDDAITELDKIFEVYHDAPMYQLVLSEGLNNYELDEWQERTALYDTKPLFDMILICDDEADFLID